jgi:hypothetical protein
LNPKNNLAGKVVAICQPNFMPWLGYFEMGHRADVYVMLDDVQFMKREWANRNKIMSSSVNGWQLIVVPLKKNKQECFINEMEIYNDGNWNEKMIKTLHHVYCKSPFYNEYIGPIVSVLSKNWFMLVDLNVAIIRAIYEMLNIEDNIVMSSELDVGFKRDDKLVRLCEKLNASTYLANNGSKPYINNSKFFKNDIGFVFQDYQHPHYFTGKNNFQPFLSVIDLIFWNGAESLSIVLKGRKKNWEEDIACT